MPTRRSTAIEVIGTDMAETANAGRIHIRTSAANGTECMETLISFFGPRPESNSDLLNIY